jgi:hypothetical protein
MDALPPGTHWIAGWMGSRASLDAVANGKFSIIAPARNRNPIFSNILFSTLFSNTLAFFY